MAGKKTGPRLRMTSIRHFPATHPLPDWRNLGVLLRLMLGVNLLALLAALVMSGRVAQWPGRYLEVAALVEPLLLASLGGLVVLRDWLWRLPLRLAQALVLVLVVLLTCVLELVVQGLGLSEGASFLRDLLLAIAGAVVMLAYFETRNRAISPALTEARLAALNARIRPHFLFNSLNAVLSLIRARPQQAEEALESLSDLFRAAMRDPAEQVALADEIALARQYLDLEKLRLGERLQTCWLGGNIAVDCMIPPMILQPLLENAVYHGIEPAAEGGEIQISIQEDDEMLIIAIENPTQADVAHAPGNRMALDNIRERLALYYDLEARLEIDSSANRFRVCISLPCRRKIA